MDESTKLSPLTNGSHRVRPQFALRTLLIWIALLCGLFAAMVAVGPQLSVLLAWFACLASLHVMGNSLGTRLRDQADRQLATGQRPASDISLKRPTATGSAHMRQKAALGWPALISTIVAALVGGSFGAVALGVWGNASWGATCVAAMSVGVICGFVGFMLGSFLQVTTCALHDAGRETRRPAEAKLAATPPVQKLAFIAPTEPRSIASGLRLVQPSVGSACS